MSQEKVGVTYAIINAMLWSFFPILSALSLVSLGPFYSLLLSNFAGACVLALIMWRKNLWHELFKKDQWANLFYIALILSVSFYGLIFIGLKYTTTGNTGIILLMEILFSYIYFGIREKEKYHTLHIVGSCLMVIGAAIVLFPGKIDLNKGDLLVLIATMIAPFGNAFQKRARTSISSTSVVFGRFTFSLPFLIVLAYIFDPIPTASDIQSSLPVVLLNGIFMFAISKILWVESIHRIPVARSLSFETLSPPLTLLFGYLIISQTPTIWQITGVIPIMIGTICLLQNNFGGHEFKTK